MVYIKDHWEHVHDLQDVSNIIREYYNSDLADELDRLIPNYSDDEYRDLVNELEEKDGEIESLKDENDMLANHIETLEERIEMLEDKEDE